MCGYGGVMGGDEEHGGGGEGEMRERRRGEDLDSDRHLFQGKV